MKWSTFMMYGLSKKFNHFQSIIYFSGVVLISIGLVDGASTQELKVLGSGPGRALDFSIQNNYVYVYTSLKTILVIRDT